MDADTRSTLSNRSVNPEPSKTSPLVQAAAAIQLLVGLLKLVDELHKLGWF